MILCSLLAIAVALAVAWVALVVALAVARPDDAKLSDATRILPDLIRLVRGLAADPTIPRRARVTLWLLVGYLLSPVDLIPDFVPVLGYADDAIIAAIALRRVVRIAGRDAIDRHWAGSPAALVVVRRLAGIRDP